MFTDKELDIAFDVASGLSNPAIARKRFITVATVKTHLHKIFRKLGFENSQSQGYDARVLLANYMNKRRGYDE